MSIRDLTVSAIWDEEAKVWVATSDDLPGLCVEEETFEDMMSTVAGLVPDLLALNGISLPSDMQAIPLHMVAERSGVIDLCH